MLEKAQNIKHRIVEWRRAIHRNPELCFEEVQTAQLVAHALTEVGARVQTGVGKTGVVGTLGNQEKPVVALRADMDALPIQELAQVEYASQVPNKMHACGHDAHTAMLLGAALLLSKEDLPGQVRLLFQPSEENWDAERLGGAQRMINDGALIGVESIAALHVDSNMETGKISVEAGPFSAACDTFKVDILGKGGHGAHPNLTVDPFWLATQVLNGIYSIPSRRFDPFEPVILSVGILQGGLADNVIPDAVHIEGTIRSMSEKTRREIHKELEHCLAMTRAWGGDYRLTLELGSPSVMNDRGVVETIQASVRDLLGQAALLPYEKSMGGEDFSYMTAECPGAMFNLGVRKPGQQVIPLHSPRFILDEDALPVGSAILADTALRMLKELG